MSTNRLEYVEDPVTFDKKRICRGFILQAPTSFVFRSRGKVCVRSTLSEPACGIALGMLLLLL